MGGRGRVRGGGRRGGGRRGGRRKGMGKEGRGRSYPQHRRRAAGAPSHVDITFVVFDLPGKDPHRRGGGGGPHLEDGPTRRRAPPAGVVGMAPPGGE